MKKTYVYGGGKRQQKRSKLPLILGIVAAVLVLVLCIVLFGDKPQDTADPDENQQTQQTDSDVNTNTNVDINNSTDGNTDVITDAGLNGDEGVIADPNVQGDENPNSGDEAGDSPDTTGDPNVGEDPNTTDTDNPAAEGMPDRGPEPIPDPKKDSRPWNLVLVNPWNFLPETADIPLEWSRYDCRVDARCLDALNRMLDDCSAAGLTPIVCSSYRTWDTQTSLFNGTVDYYQYTLGMPYEEAKAAAAMETAWPGTSEHQLGLAVDIVDVNYQLLNDAQADTAVQQWLMANCWKYGFILRYPADKVAQTGIIYEPWHYRYVGEEYAKAIYDSGLCLEEWLAQN